MKFQEMTILPLSDKEKAVLLREGRASELVPGGVWYKKNDHDGFDRVETSESNMESDGYRDFVQDCSKKGLIYLNREKSNYSITNETQIFDKEQIKKLTQWKMKK